MDDKQNNSLVKYAPYSLEEAANDQRELDSAGGANLFIKLHVGRNKFRVLPPPQGLMRSDGKPATWRRVTYVHYVDAPGAGRVQIVCPRTEARRACVICAESKRLLDHADHLEGSGKIVAAEADRKRGKKLAAKLRAYANVIDREHPENGPMVLGMSQTVMDGLVAIRQDLDEGGDFTDPGPKGFDVIIEREGTGEFDTRYKVRRSKNDGPLHADTAQAMAWLEGQHGLDRYCRVHSDADIAKLLRGETPDGHPAAGGGGRQRTIQDDVEGRAGITDSDDDEDEDAEDGDDETITIG